MAVAAVRPKFHWQNLLRLFSFLYFVHLHIFSLTSSCQWPEHQSQHAILKDLIPKTQLEDSSEEREGLLGELWARMHKFIICQSLFSACEEAWHTVGVYKTWAGAGLHKFSFFIHKLYQLFEMIKCAIKISPLHSLCSSSQHAVLRLHSLITFHIDITSVTSCPVVNWVKHY